MASASRGASGFAPGLRQADERRRISVISSFASDAENDREVRKGDSAARNNRVSTKGILSKGGMMWRTQSAESLSIAWTGRFVRRIDRR